MIVSVGGDSTHTSASGRIILGIWWMCTILILELYTANLAAYLTIPPAKSPIKNLEQLAASSDYKPLVKTGSNLDFLFRVNMLHLYYIDTTEHAMLEHIHKYLFQYFIYSVIRGQKVGYTNKFKRKWTRCL